jgi:hypothetical protein
MSPDPIVYQAYITVSIENPSEDEALMSKRIEEALNGTKVLAVKGTEVIKFQFQEKEAG